MRLLVTGGSGFIGTTVVSRALARGDQVLNIDIKAPNLDTHRPYWRELNILDRDGLIRAVTDFKPDYVIHLAAATGVDVPIPDPSHFLTNTQGVDNLVAAIRAAGTVRRTIYTSSLLVCRNGYLPKSDLDYCPPNPYGQSKVDGELIVRHSDHGSEWVIVRPTSVWGPWFEHSYKKFFQIVSRGLYVHIQKAANIIKPITYVGNAAFMMETLLIASGNRVASQTFYLGDYPESTVRQWAETVRRETGTRWIPTMPYVLLKLLALVGDGVKLLGWHGFPLTSFRLSNLVTGAHYPIEKTQDAVGPLPYALADGVRETVHWMRNQNLLPASRR
ncbi:MAG TPA: NAD(P)-dependent oxidoreductase [Rhizomicrobium sp.]|jgi:nucleoside-diphosphate-sugar epimerase|nr:NAD(P)-dependent oxidoreductase [Rhizomicrobium sp.]